MPLFALADCNNFFVSCERIFNASLVGKPTVVLSSNDACVIARSNEAKALGIKMGEPAFKLKNLFKVHQVNVLSANFTLYGDISSRVMQTIDNMVPELEVYSIDECFFFLPQAPELNDPTTFSTDYCKTIRNTVKQCIGIPTSIGLGPTKTLAKIANALAKKSADGVFNISALNTEQIDALLETIPVEDIWGINYGYKNKLATKRISNAKQLKYLGLAVARKLLTIHGARTVQELNGVSCLALQEDHDPKKSICVSRSFGQNISRLDELKEALASYVIAAGEKLRKQKMLCQQMMVFFSYQNHGEPYRFYRSGYSQLPISTDFTPDLIKAAGSCLEDIFLHGVLYKKVGIVLDDFVGSDQLQMSTLYALPTNTEKQKNLMKVIDTVNAKFGRNSATFLAGGIEKKWANRANHKSRRFTTFWAEILTIKI